MTGSPFLEQVRNAIRVRHYSIRTEQAYIQWIKHFIFYHNKRHPKDMGEEEIRHFLTYLATGRNVSPSTQNQALNALNFLYRQVLDRELSGIDFVRAKKEGKLPVVLTADEVIAVLNNLDGIYWMMGNLLYGAGLRLMECLKLLRVKDLDFSHRAILVRDGKGGKNRVTILPDPGIPQLKVHLQNCQLIHQREPAQGFGTVYLPYALERKYPNANKEWGWQHVFPAKQRSKDPRSGRMQRHHVYPRSLQKVVNTAVPKAGIIKPASCHTFRHCFATHRNKGTRPFYGGEC